MKYRVTHTTEFIYEAQVGLCYNEARLLPRELPQQKVLSAALQIDPPPDDHYERYDYFGNRTDYFSIQQPHEQLVVTATSEVVTGKSTLFDNSAPLPWEAARERLRNERDAASIEACQFILDSPSVTSMSCCPTMPGPPSRRAGRWLKPSMT